MPIIKQLPLDEAQKIAAGEVVERPANIVKELVENAIDAHATKITISIKEGGKELIRVVDNGTGMDAVDAVACFSQHATSKISTLSDIIHVETFGFRGEALASIASVSHVELITKTSDGTGGTHVVASKGIISTPATVAAPRGTSITITHLFAAIPARRKFLKTDQTESRAIQQLVAAFIISNPLIHITLVSDDTILMNAPSIGDIKSRYSCINGAVGADRLLAISGKRAQPSITIEGCIANQHSYRYDRNHLFLFVNNRWVKDSKISNAIIKGFAGSLPPGKFPIAAVKISIDPHHIDVNTHPRKEEIRFMNPLIVAQLVQLSVKEALESQIIYRQASPHPLTSNNIPTVPQSMSFPEAPFPFFINQRRETLNTKQDLPEKISGAPSSLTHQPVPALSTDVQYTIPATSAAEFSILGQLFTTYILIEQDRNLIMIDQHAAHERILYEQYKSRFTDLTVTKLTTSIVVQIAASALETLMECESSLVQLGIHLQKIGHESCAVNALAAHLKSTSLTDLLPEIARWIDEYKENAPEPLFDFIHKKLRAQWACKNAVKAGDILSVEQMQHIVKQLSTTDNKLTCPHGRPTNWIISQYECERKFKRRV